VKTLSSHLNTDELTLALQGMLMSNAFEARVLKVFSNPDTVQSLTICKFRHDC